MQETSINQALRKEMKQRRAALSIGEKRKRDREIRHQVAAWLADKAVRHICIYHSVPQEINTLPLIVDLLEKDYSVYLPKVREKTLQAVRIRGIDFPYTYFHAVKQPLSDELCATKDLDVVIVPCLAYNAQYYRLGYGGGYYDRFLAEYPQLILCLAYDFQYSDALVVHSGDKPFTDLIVA